MCTIVVVHGIQPELGTVVAANRDEFYGRRTAPPRLLRESPRVVGGVDLEQGGTWMGVTGEGAFVALTNQRRWTGADPSLRSRGEITLGMLEQGAVGAMRRWLEALDPGRYNAFNAMFGDARQLFVAYGRPDGPAVDVQGLGPGVHVLVNDRMGSPEFPKAGRAHELTEPHAGRPWPELREALERMLADHQLPPAESLPDPPPEAAWPKEALARLQALCTHTELYGTRSSAIVALAGQKVAHYLHAEGPPCRTRFEPLTHLLHA